MRNILEDEIKKERCNAAALGAYNAGVIDAGSNSNLSYDEVISFDEFKKMARAERYSDKHQVTGSFSHTININKMFKVYVDTETLEPISSIYSKKNKGKKYKSFTASGSQDFAKKMAYDWIVETSKFKK